MTTKDQELNQKRNSMELIIGKNYEVFSSRKGKFKMNLTHQDDAWATGVIIQGKAKAICSYNERMAGEEVTVRKELSSFTLIK